MQNIPIIDVSPLRSADPEQRAACAAVLGRTCRDIGFFYATGHGIPPAVASGIFDAARAFFAQPTEVKNRVSYALSAHNRGYIGLGQERLDAATPPDRKEAFNVGLELAPDDPELLAGKPFRGVNLWPDLPGWRDMALAYYEACTRLTVEIHRGFALDLGLEEEFFTPRLDRPMTTLRLLHYPAGDGADLGAGTHTDYGNLTILATDGVAGLQVRHRDGTWIDAPHVPGAFVCNIGDCLMRWTNDVYVSTPHRVRQPATERYSVAYFCDPGPDALVEVLPTCLKPGEVPKYQPISAAAYLRSRLDPTYQHWKPGQHLKSAQHLNSGHDPKSAQHLKSGETVAS
jgi:isopenicillin N synthase-like dioxygenase